MPISAPPVSKQSSSSQPSLNGNSFWHRAVSVLKQPLLIASVAVTALLLGVRQVGWLQPLELSAFDQSMRLRPALPPDPRLLVVTITEEDLQKQAKWPLTDAVMYQLLEKLEQYQPVAIGLDNYRDIPVEPGHQELANLIKKSDRIVPVCKLKEGDSPETPPPPYVPSERVGFSDMLIDTDGVIRRSQLFLGDPIPNARCNTLFSLSFQLAQRYLEKKGIQPELTPQQHLQMGKVVFKRLESTSGGYQNLDARGYQILLNYRSANNISREVTLTQVLSGQLQPDWVKDRIVIIGSTAGSLKDDFSTPYSPGQQRNQKMAGVVVHAQMVSQLLSAVLDGKPVFWFWSNWEEALWIWVWSLTGGIIVWRLRHPGRLALAGGVSSSVLLGTCWILFTQGGWVPVIPPVLALVVTGGGVVAYTTWQAQQDQKKIIQQAQEQEKTIAQLKALLKSDAPAMRFKVPAEEETLEMTAIAPPKNILEDTAIAPQKETLEDTAIAPEDETLAATSSTTGNDTGGKRKKNDLLPSRSDTLRTSLLKGRYKILRVLGAGGFGLTYLSEDTQRPGNPKCVVKHLRPARSDEKFMKLARRLFTTEAEILEKLGNHSQIPQLLAYFEENQEFYLVQELIEGHALCDELPIDKRLPEGKVVEIVHGILEILDFIHERRVIHRDIKPSNIIRREQDNKLVLIDFGAVKQIQPQELSEQEGFTVSIGTRGYTSHEQMMGQPNVTSDIFALGMIGVQAVTGIHPHQIPHDSISGDIYWRELSNVGEEFGDILDKMVRYHHIERYQSAKEVMHDLKQFSNGIKDKINAES